MADRDFTLEKYKALLKALKEYNYDFYTFESFLIEKKLPKKVVILRHDVDKRPKNSLKIAKIEKEFGIKASYYFRIDKNSYNKDIIKQIVKLGHEVGYHYEDLSLAKGNYERAIEHFEKNLKKIRQFFDVKTICMHGSPLSKWDNSLIWNKYDYRNYGVIGEPYFDVDFNKVLYLTDTGRAWNRTNTNIRDKVNSKFNYEFNSTYEIISALKNDMLPNQIIINTHPQRWTNSLLPWLKEFIWQNIKNIGKRFLV